MPPSTVGTESGKGGLLIGIHKQLRRVPGRTEQLASSPPGSTRLRAAWLRYPPFEVYPAGVRKA